MNRRQRRVFGRKVGGQLATQTKWLNELQERRLFLLASGRAAEAAEVKERIDHKVAMLQRFHQQAMAAEREII